MIILAATDNQPGLAADLMEAPFHLVLKSLLLKLREREEMERELERG